MLHFNQWTRIFMYASFSRYTLSEIFSFYNENLPELRIGQWNENYGLLV